MLEKDFLDSIDGKFPYNDLSKGRNIIDLAIKISNNSVFCVIEELVRIPRGLKKKVDKTILYMLLEYIDANFHHSLKEDIIGISYKLIEGQEIRESEAIVMMNKIKLYKGLYGALDIIYFSVDDLGGVIEQKYNEIIQVWK